MLSSLNRVMFAYSLSLGTRCQPSGMRIRKNLRFGEHNVYTNRLCFKRCTKFPDSTGSNPRGLLCKRSKNKLLFEVNANLETKSPRTKTRELRIAFKTPRDRKVRTTTPIVVAAQSRNDIKTVADKFRSGSIFRGF